ncbi:hypothetical protein K461DRAFT_168593 [Myriangium duriaei CBS 260.36]|uniref:Uncharacterized protein n=1 Tax=Myriangium duriaei CBS 260.36 TaxID=1168546 RepID=A0A9P4J0F2_9PEZI|nr:hypothetical protein K461DRAFT_168593 [Myriangium duriaei CBS 260.36]
MCGKSSRWWDPKNFRHGSEYMARRRRKSRPVNDEKEGYHTILPLRVLCPTPPLVLSWTGALAAWWLRRRFHSEQLQKKKSNGFLLNKPISSCRYWQHCCYCYKVSRDC